MHTQPQQRWVVAWWIGSMLGSGLLLLCALAFGAADESRYDALIHVAVQQHGLEAALVKAVIKCESGFNPLAVSARGAQGLMQLMPTTQALLGVTDAFAPQENVMAGVRYLSMLQQLFASNVSLMLAAYNAGPQAVLAAGSAIPPMAETQNFVQCVLTAWQRYRQPGRTPSLPALSPAPALTQTASNNTVQVQALRFSQPVAQVGQQVTVSLDMVQAGPQTSHGVVMLMYPEPLVSYVMLHTTGNITTVRVPETSAGQLGKASWITNTYQILRNDWPEWWPGQRRTMTLALVPRVPQDITLHLSIFLYNTSVSTVQNRWSTMVRLPVRTNQW